MGISVAKCAQIEYNQAATGERRVQQTSEWNIKKRVSQSKFRPLKQVVNAASRNLINTAKAKGLFAKQVLLRPVKDHVGFIFP
jgi:hypothetical protein